MTKGRKPTSYEGWLHSPENELIGSSHRSISTGKWVCFDCRKVFAQDFERDKPVTCPDCGQSMTYAGVHFAAPRRNQVKQWNALKKRYGR
jgi:DNA-directed RNA polymerase subunit RPC12/RpoP